MDAFTLPAMKLGRSERKTLVDHLTREGSDFQRALLDGTQKGVICLAMDRGEIIGWSRTERWQDWQTLESYVLSPYRRRGIATFCALGLAAGQAFANGQVAVFSTAMVPIAVRCGLSPTRFSLREGQWCLA